MTSSKNKKRTTAATATAADAQVFDGGPFPADREAFGRINAASLAADETSVAVTGVGGVSKARTFRHRGKQITITLVAPKVYPEMSMVEYTSNLIWNFDGDLKSLSDPVRIRGFYTPATYAVDGFGYSITMTTGLNDPFPGGRALRNSDPMMPAIAITEMKMTGNNAQREMVLPLERLRVYALQLAGVFGIAYPPNYRKYRGDITGEQDIRELLARTVDGIPYSDLIPESYFYFDSGPEGVIEVERYGYRITRTSALELLGEHDRPKRLTCDETLLQVAQLHKKHPHHGKYQFIADELKISYSMAKTLVAECRKPSVALLPPTGRTRTKPKPPAKKRGKK